MTIIAAELRQAAPAAAALGAAMNPLQRAQFQDKLTRYARKPDRDLFLARHGDRTVGFSTVIQFLKPPRDIAADHAQALDQLACGTGLLVLAPWRGQGLGRRLVAQWETWAAERGCAGVWCVTHRMADWYRERLGYQKRCTTLARGVVKTIMVKRFARSNYP